MHIGNSRTRAAVGACVLAALFSGPLSAADPEPFPDIPLALGPVATNAQELLKGSLVGTYASNVQILSLQYTLTF